MARISMYVAVETMMTDPPGIAPLARQPPLATYLALRTHMLTFPFCIVRLRAGSDSVPISPSAGYVAAFSSVERAAAYTFKRGDTEWRTTLVTRPTLAETIQVLRVLGIKGFAFDPIDDKPGELIDFEDVPTV